MRLLSLKITGKTSVKGGSFLCWEQVAKGSIRVEKNVHISYMRMNTPPSKILVSALPTFVLFNIIRLSLFPTVPPSQSIILFKSDSAAKSCPRYFTQLGLFLTGVSLSRWSSWCTCSSEPCLTLQPYQHLYCHLPDFWNNGLTVHSPINTPCPCHLMALHHIIQRMTRIHLLSKN